MGTGRGRRNRREDSRDPASRKGYVIAYSPEAVEHIRGPKIWQQRVLKDTIEAQLRFEPATRTANRKPLLPNPLAPWELRVDELRVYYDVGMDPVPTVLIRAVGVKERNRVLIGGEVYPL